MDASYTNPINAHVHIILDHFGCTIEQWKPFTVLYEEMAIAHNSFDDDMFQRVMCARIRCVKLIVSLACSLRVLSQRISQQFLNPLVAWCNFKHNLSYHMR